jgi:iron complex outermembrane receptor protein
MRCRGYVLAGVLTPCLAIPATGQTESAQADEGPAVVEEIVVTARKRDEKLTETPLSVTALSSSDLDRRQVDDLGGLRDIVPNLSVNMGDAANAIVYIRGVGQRDSLSFADPGVGIYLDDVYLGRSQGAFLEVIDIERIEVLRGPQGTLYGRNTIGGAIKYVSVAPSPEPEVVVEAGLGDFSQRIARVTLNGPLGSGDALLGRVSVAYGSHEGYRVNTNPNAEPIDGDKDLFAWRGQLDFAATDQLTLRLIADRSENDPQRSITPVRVTSGPVLVAATAKKPASPSTTQVEADFNNVELLHVSGASLAAEFAFSDHVAFRSTTAYREVQHQTHIDLDGTGRGIFGVLVDQDQQQQSQEFQLSLDFADFQGVMGAYWFSEDDVTPDGIRNTEPIDFAGGAGFFLPYNTVSENDQSIEAQAVFGEFSWQLLPAVELSAGVRYTDEARELRRKACQAFSTEALDIDACNPSAGSLNPFALRLDLEASFSAVTPKVGIAFDSDAGLIYANWARGFKSGGFDGRIGYNGASSTGAVGAQAQAYDPEFADTFEIGWKAAATDGDWQMSTAMFFTDYTDLQLSSFSATPGGGFATVFTNAGKAETLGLEVEYAARTSENLFVNVNLGYLDAQYQEFIDARGNDVSGERTPINAPKWTASIGFQSLFPLEHGRLRFSADLGYRSEYHVDINNLEALAQDGYGVINASVDYEDGDARWRVSLGVKNLTDAEYITHGFDLTAFPGVGLAYYGDPRTYRLGVRYRFL